MISMVSNIEQHDYSITPRNPEFNYQINLLIIPFINP